MSALEIWRLFSTTISDLFEVESSLDVFAPKEYIHLYIQVSMLLRGQEEEEEEEEEERGGRNASGMEGFKKKKGWRWWQWEGDGQCRGWNKADQSNNYASSAP